MLNVTESYSLVMKFVNLLLPLGIYTIIMSLWKRVGVTIYILFPILFLCAFQIVLLYLYGDSIIAVDMFLNVVTTTMSEATELLSNLGVSIFCVCVLYLTPILWGIFTSSKKIYLPSDFRKKLRLWGICLTACGLALAGIDLLTINQGRFSREIFPVNVIQNMGIARSRFKETQCYKQTSARFKYDAHSTNENNGEKEIYLYVVGETSRAVNWELNGYGRPTNPSLSKIKNLVFFKKAISESNTTHKSVPLLLSFASAENFDSINHFKSIVSAMKEAGFYTRFFSNQPPNKSYIQFFGEEAEEVTYTKKKAHVHPHPYDEDLIPLVRKAIADSSHTRQFIVLHTYGSHFRYNDRYPADKAFFKPDRIIDVNPSKRHVLVNAYDNSIRYTDEILGTLIKELQNSGGKCALLYSADHGEDIIDDNRKKFLHASPTPTYYQLHVAMLAWLSDSICEEHPEYMRELRLNAEKCVSPQKAMFNTALELTGVKTSRFNPTHSLANKQYRYEQPVFINDFNEAIPLFDSGIDDNDKELFNKLFAR